MRRVAILATLVATVLSSAVSVRASLLETEPSVSVGPEYFWQANAHLYDGGISTVVDVYGIDVAARTANVRVEVYDGDPWAGPPPTTYEFGEIDGAVDDVSFDPVTGTLRLEATVPTTARTGSTSLPSQVAIDLTMVAGPDRSCSPGPMDGTSMELPLPVYTYMGGVVLWCGSRLPLMFGHVRSARVDATMRDLREGHESSITWRRDIPITLDATP